MFSKCSGYTPQLRKMETVMPSMPDSIISDASLNPIRMIPTQPAMPGISPDPPADPPAAANPASPARGVPPVTNQPTGSQPAVNQPAVTVPTTPAAPRNPMLPELIPEAPYFTVPSNPLLPPEYQEILNYDSLQYLNGFLRTQIGKGCDIQFLVGSDSMTTRTGTLIGVGINYILLLDQHTGETMACDFYSIKFIDFHL